MLTDLHKSYLEDAMPSFSIDDIKKKCLSKSDPICKKPNSEKILETRWNASVEQFKDQRVSAYNYVIAKKNSLILNALRDQLAEQQLEEFNNLYSLHSGNLEPEIVFKSMNKELTEEVIAIVEERDSLDNNLVSFEADQTIKKIDSFLSETKRQIEEKIFVNPEQGGENLSAIEVAIKKSTALIDGEEAAKNNLQKLGFLEYAAKGVFSKAIKAKNKLDTNPRDTVEAENWGQKDSEQWKKESQKVWNSRFIRTDFAGVDLSGTFRTVFVNCTFDENCVLPTDKSSIDQKYFSKCKFSKELMDKEENKELKAALDLTENDDFYEVSEMKRGKYGEKDREGKPNSSFKPIESFQFIKDFKPVERDGH
jgi:hypothetical protein